MRSRTACANSKTDPQIMMQPGTMHCSSQAYLLAPCCFYALRMLPMVAAASFCAEVVTWA